MARTRINGGAARWKYGETQTVLRKQEFLAEASSSPAAKKKFTTERTETKEKSTSAGASRD
jgi:hypothetical protein